MPSSVPSSAPPRSRARRPRRSPPSRTLARETRGIRRLKRVGGDDRGGSDVSNVALAFLRAHGAAAAAGTRARCALAAAAAAAGDDRARGDHSRPPRRGSSFRRGVTKLASSRREASSGKLRRFRGGFGVLAAGDGRGRRRRGRRAPRRAPARPGAEGGCGCAGADGGGGGARGVQDSRGRARERVEVAAAVGARVVVARGGRDDAGGGGCAGDAAGDISRIDGLASGGHLPVASAAPAIKSRVMSKIFKSKDQQSAAFVSAQLLRQTLESGMSRKGTFRCPGCGPVT